MPSITAYTENLFTDESAIASQYLFLEDDGLNNKFSPYEPIFSCSPAKMIPAVTDLVGGSASAQLAPFATQAIGAGTIAQIASVANHPGIWRVASAAGANTGNGIGLVYISTILLEGDECYDCVFQLQSTTNLVARLGFYDEVTLAANPTDGAWIDIAATTLTGKTANNTAISTTVSSYAVATATWYRARVKVSEDATSVTFTLYSAAGAVLWTDTLTTNIPTAAGRETGVFALAIKTTATGANLIDIDWCALSSWKYLGRGA